MFLALHSVTVAHGAEDVPNLCPEAVAENMLSASQHWQPLQSIKDFCNGTLTSLGNPVAYNGNSKLVWEFFRRAATGQRLSVVILGGSVAACHATGGHDSPQCWSFMLQTWFAMHFPRVNVTNRAMPATTSSYAARCVANLVPEDVDLVIIEFALNDYSEDRHSAEVSQFLSQQTAPSCDLGAKANRLGYERLVRKLALWPSRPAIIGLQFWSDNMGDAAFWKTSEDEIETVLKYYQVPSLSYRGTYYDAVVDGCPCFSHAAAYADFSHPNQLGNSYLARVVTMYFEQTLVTMPRLKGARSFPSTPPKVPTKPMFPGNEGGASNTALQQAPGGQQGLQMPVPGQYGSPTAYPQPGMAYAQQLQAQTAQLRAFWEQQAQEIQQVGNDPAEFKNHQLPLARIKKIMKSDEDVRMISAEAPVLFAKACEMFILELTLRSWSHSEENKRRTLQRNDIAAAITRTDIFDFLVDIVPREERTEEGTARPAHGAPSPQAMPNPGAGMSYGHWQPQMMGGAPGNEHMMQSRPPVPVDPSMMNYMPGYMPGQWPGMAQHQGMAQQQVVMQPDHQQQQMQQQQLQQQHSQQHQGDESQYKVDGQ
ncbi:hypothetical protein WJX72_006778 [[Myrmecia] bisecta]|uniref:Transcription factor CBF/NF-Y/archaeal histone domain-containing protein n=1 Tax=[Myrmecia] bisecta TaxID=41462 RepID=A0AAW1PP61_9CHLO